MLSTILCKIPVPPHYIPVEHSVIHVIYVDLATESAFLNNIACFRSSHVEGIELSVIELRTSTAERRMYARRTNIPSHLPRALYPPLCCGVEKCVTVENSLCAGILSLVGINRIGVMLCYCFRSVFAALSRRPQSWFRSIILRR